MNILNYKERIYSYISEYGLKHIDTDDFLDKITLGTTSDMSPADLAVFCGEVAATLLTHHSDYAKLAGIILTKFHHTITLDTFSEKFKLLAENTSILNPTIYEMIMKNASTYDSMIDYSRDFNLSYFALTSLIRSYMLRLIRSQ